MTTRVLSYGGGVQSTALLVLAAQGQVDIDVALFANVGDDSEHPATLAYVRDIATPWAASHGIPVHEIHATREDEPETLLGQLTRSGSRSISIPVRMDGGAPGNRRCTADFKLRPIGRWLREHGATAAAPALVAIGISTDEVGRIGRKRSAPYERARYPLIDLGLDRSACAELIRRAGLPVPPKSACWFCPFHTLQTWAEMARDEPDLFDKAAQLEAELIARRAELGKDPVYLTRRGRPLRDAITTAQDQLPFESIEESGCDEGTCFV